MGGAVTGGSGLGGSGLGGSGLGGSGAGGDLPRVFVARTADWTTVARSRAALLSPEERARHGALRRAEDRDTWLVAHVVTRLVLAELIGSDPAGLRFADRAHPQGAVDGKPWCRDAPTLDFSLSHTRGLSCLAVSGDGLVGLDAEALAEPAFPPPPLPTELLRRQTTGPERHALERLAPASVGAAFAQLWCRKEACAKAVGIGVAAPFDRFSVDRDGPHPPELVDPRARTWSCFDLEVGSGYRAAVAFTSRRAAPPPVLRLPPWTSGPRS